MKLLTGAVCDDPIYIEPDEESLISSSKARKNLRNALAHHKVSNAVPIVAVTKDIALALISSALLVATICAVIGSLG